MTQMWRYLQDSEVHQLALHWQQTSTSGSNGLGCDFLWAGPDCQFTVRIAPMMTWWVMRSPNFLKWLRARSFEWTTWRRMAQSRRMILGCFETSMKATN